MSWVDKDDEGGRKGRQDRMWSEVRIAGKLSIVPVVEGALRVNSASQILV